MDDVRCLASKYELVPAFLAVRGLVKQHLDSFDFLVASELASIVAAKANQRVTCDADPGFYLKYTAIHVGVPSLEEHCVTVGLTPQDCRVRDLTYAAPIFVDVEYTRGKDVVVLRGSGTGGGICIGRLPVMLRSAVCVLRGADEAQLARMGECPLDPGGYFIIRGAEKVVQIQEQLSKNRMILDTDTKGHVTASVTSSTHERKSKTHVTLRAGRLYLRHNTLGDDVPLLIVLRAMGLTCAQEFVALVASGGGAGCGAAEGALASDDVIMSHVLGPTVAEAAHEGVFTQAQALEWIGAKVRAGAAGGGSMSTSSTTAQEHAAGQSMPSAVGATQHAGAGLSNGRFKWEEAREVLACVVLAHIPVEAYDFGAKVQYICTMASRVLAASRDPSQLDDRDYYGNKRLELAGQLLGLLFEDLFKRLNAELRRSADAGLSRANRAGAFDIAKCMRGDTISHGLEHALASGNWAVKRFRMDRKGVTQVLSRLSFISCLGMMTRIHSQFEKTRKVSGPRALQPSQWGMLCPSDTPEGEACGLVKNLALMTHVTTDADEQLLRRLAYALGTHPLPLVVGAQASSPSAIYARGGATSQRRRCCCSANTSGAGSLVFLNGHVLGTHPQPERLATSLRVVRRRGRLGEFVSVHTSPGRVSISSDGGRVCRPLIVVRGDGTPALRQHHCNLLRSGTWHFSDVLRSGLVEYLDVNEENNCLIALAESNIVAGETTHLEIEPFTVLGVVAGLIPYPHHNQSPRNTYQCAMGKQAMGAVGFNQGVRPDTLLYLLVYPAKPLVTTRQIQLTGFDRLGAGQNAIVAVMSYSGYDIEDALIVSAGALDRGFGRCTVMRKHTCIAKKYANRSEDRIVAPPLPQQAAAGGGGRGLDRGIPSRAGEHVVTTAPSQFHRAQPHQHLPTQQHHGRDRRGVLDNDGVVGVGQCIFPGDVFVNKESPVNTRDTPAAGPSAVATADGAPGGVSIGGSSGGASNFRPTPGVYRGEPALVDRVLLTLSDEGQLVVKAMARATRVPEVGDKFSSRHGQKGVLGAVVPVSDLPFCLSTGMTPDLIMNPHGFPSRMTVGKLIELLGAKAAVTGLGRFAQGTAFGGDDVATLAAALTSSGLSYDGREALACGCTGAMLSCYVFTGPVYYQKLKHMVADKMHARARGPRLVLTRQPTEGRSRDGGLRLGEMERDCLIAHGTAALLTERLCLSSDVTDVAVCTACGLLGYYHHGIKQRLCSQCGSGSGTGGEVVGVKMPYAAKLLFQELQAMNVCPRLRLQDRV